MANTNCFITCLIMCSLSKFFFFSLRTSETNYLNESFAFYSAIRMRAYYSKAEKEERFVRHRLCTVFLFLFYSLAPLWHDVSFEKKTNYLFLNLLLAVEAYCAQNIHINTSDFT